MLTGAELITIALCAVARLQAINDRGNVPEIHSTDTRISLIKIFHYVRTTPFKNNSIIDFDHPEPRIIWGKRGGNRPIDGTDIISILRSGLVGTL